MAGISTIGPKELKPRLHVHNVACTLPVSTKFLQKNFDLGAFSTLARWLLKILF